jgi:predicted Fe-Mo cluster-binding NifX family protein
MEGSMNANEKNLAKNMAKDKIVDILREAGYDFITASEIATDTIREFKASGKKRQRYYLKNGVSFVIQRS